MSEGHVVSAARLFSAGISPNATGRVPLFMLMQSHWAIDCE